MTSPTDTSYARISEDGAYRYVLGRRWADGPLVRYIMLNPSTADAAADDPTIRRCIGFARAWGHAGIQVLNLYAFRATNPADLWRTPDPVGPDNDAYLRLAADPPDEGPLIAAWGAHARPDRVVAVLDILAGAHVQCLGLTKAGQPRHPLYLAASTALSTFRAPVPAPTGPRTQRGPRIDFGSNCSWCGHAKPHGQPCEGTIQTGTSKNPETKPCPCRRNHHIQEPK